MMKEYLYCVFIILGFIDRPVFCGREDYLTNNDVMSSDKNDCNPHKDNTGESHIEFSDVDNEQNLQDRVFFPNDDDDFPSHNCNSTPRPQTVETCMNECHDDMDTNYDPVCGTDSVTYINLSQLECAMRCGVDVRIQQLSACPGWLETTTKPSLTHNEELKSCLLLCPTTQEYNPVCGTNDVTYYNFGKLFCAQVCGIDVKVKRHYPCPKKSKFTTEPVAPNSLIPYALSKEFLLCLQICPKTSEYDPVCGSNQKTYYNIAILQCARNCGIDVTVSKRLPCITENDDKIFKIDARTREVVQDSTIPQDVLDRIFQNSDEDYAY